MVWLPVAFIIFLVWYVRYINSGINRAKIEHELEVVSREKDYAIRNYCDHELERKYKKAFETDLNCGKRMLEFMKGGEEWEHFGTHDPDRIVAIDLAKHGKICYSMILGTSLSNVSNNRDHITPERGREMNEEYMLALQETLRSAGAYVTAVCTNISITPNETASYSYVPLEQIRMEHGPGFTDYCTTFCFLPR